jgi:ribosomal protein S18 acetylase RimI-like enzyme
MNICSERSLLNAVAWNGNDPIGLISCTEQTEKTKSIFLIGVDDRYRGRGIGELLMSYVVRNRLEPGGRVVVDTQSNNTATINLYQIFGFKELNQIYSFHKWMY